MKKRSFIFPMLLYLPFIMPACILEFDLVAIRHLYSIGKVVSVCVVFAWYVLKYRKCTKIMCVIFAFQFIVLVSTLINNGDYMRWLLSCASITCVCILTEMLVKSDFRRFCYSLILPTSIYAVINILTIIIYPGGMGTKNELSDGDHVWFLGYYNSHIFMLLPCVYLAFLLAYYEKERLDARAIALLTISTITVFIIWSATSVVTIVMLLVYAVFLYKVNENHFLNICTYTIISATTFFIIVIFRLQEMFAFIIENLLHKSLDLSGRTNQWDKYIYYIKQKLWLGYGNEYKNIYMSKINHLNAHDFYLQIAYFGGIAAVIIFIVMIFVTGKKLLMFKNNKLSRILSYVIFVYLIRFITEAHWDFMLEFMLFVIAYHVDVIIEQHNKYQLLKKVNNPNIAQGRVNEKLTISEK